MPTEYPTTTTAVICDTSAKVHDMVERLLQAELVVYDTETSGHTGVKAKAGLDMRVAQVLCFSFADCAGTGFVVPMKGRLPHETLSYTERARDPITKNFLRGPDGKGYDITYEYEQPLGWDWLTGTYPKESLPEFWSAADRITVLDELRRLFESGTAMCAQNSKFDMHVIATLGIRVKQTQFDTRLAHALVAEEDPHDLETLRKHYTNVAYYEGWKKTYTVYSTKPSGKPFKHKFRSGDSYALIPTEMRDQYAAADADTTWRVAEELMKAIDAEGQATWDILNLIAMPLNEALFEIEQTGAYVDVERLARVNTQYSEAIRHKELELDAIAGHPIASTNNDDVAALLYDQLGLPVLKRTPTGDRSIDAPTLSELASDVTTDHPVLGILRQLSKMKTMRNTFLAGKDDQSGLRKHLDEKGRIHTSYSATLTTGRLSSSPNLQNIPNPGKGGLDQEDDIAPEVLAEAAEVRGIFSGYVDDDGEEVWIVGADYSQLELRIQAEFCNEPLLKAAFARGEVDQHRLTAAEVLGIPESEVTDAQRKDAKRVNFGFGYGGGVPMVIRSTGWDEDRAREFLEKLRAAYPATEAMRRQIARQIARDGYVDSPVGRRRHFPKYAALAARLRALGRTERGDPVAAELRKAIARIERQGYNHDIQSTGSDIMSFSTIELGHNELLHETKTKMFLSLHDAGYFYVKRKHLDVVIPEIGRVMTWVPQHYLGWHIPVDIEAGPRWGDHVISVKGERTPPNLQQVTAA